MKKILLSLLTISSILMASDGAELYKKCAGCHGAVGEKKALGKSKVIATLSQADLVTAIKGYQDGSYGASMKALMKGQVAKLSDEEIKVLAQHIVNLNK